MKKCSCSIVTMDKVVHACAPATRNVPLTEKARCNECGRMVDNGNVYFRPKVHVLCSECLEIARCFICTATLGHVWSDIRNNLDKIGLGMLPDYLSKDAQDLLISKIDEWEEILFRKF